MSNQQLLNPVPTVEPPLGKENGWVYLADLPTPPEVAEVMDAACKGQRFSEQERQELLERSKFEYYFAGKVVSFLETPRGLAIVASDDMPQTDYDAAKARLSPSDRAKLVATIPPYFNEPIQRVF